MLSSAELGAAGYIFCSFWGPETAQQGQAHPEIRVAKRADIGAWAPFPSHTSPSASQTSGTFLFYDYHSLPAPLLQSQLPSGKLRKF